MSHCTIQYHSIPWKQFLADSFSFPPKSYPLQLPFRFKSEQTGVRREVRLKSDVVSIKGRDGNGGHCGGARSN
ncbi:unnamed protein product [Citrullus colocynthis]|uniref:Uncharacterized protein n=1 Tax=Citrullus colocynthis TaxID=252529 RepID=A0ABP0Z7M4_9ROSI